MRNPKWHRDEIILALDLYFSKDLGSVDKSNPKIIETSRILNLLPIFTDRPDEEKFRNANGVTLKLSNFKHIDPAYKGLGMSSGSKLDKIVFDEFNSNREKLKELASEICKVADDAMLRSTLLHVEEDEQTLLDNVFEGQVLYKLHKVRERNAKIILSKKNQVLTQKGKLACEACVFEFENYYGELGQGYIECHHRTPLSTLKVSTQTSLDDLALVCANCHRMLHRRIDSLTVEDLGMLIRYDRA